MDENEFYFGVYRDVQDNGLSGWYIRQSHRSLEQLPIVQSGQVILEVGGNIGEHIQFVDQNYSAYTLTDYRDTKFASKNSKIQFRVADVENLPFPEESFDRTISTCLLHHVGDPIKALNEIRRVTRAGGMISLLIPCDPGLAYRLAKKLGASKKWKESGIQDPNFYHYTQHRNHYPGLDAFVHKVFKIDKIIKRNWPLPLNSWNLNLFTTYQIKKVLPDETS